MVVVSVAAVLVAAAAVTSLRWKRSWADFVRQWRTELKEKPETKANRVSVSEGLLGAIGNTPLIKIRSLSDATGCEVRTLNAVDRFNVS